MIMELSIQSVLKCHPHDHQTVLLHDFNIHLIDYEPSTTEKGYDYFSEFC